MPGVVGDRRFQEEALLAYLRAVAALVAIRHGA
jgi:hypothetical protein